jgi:hypothetical protein
MWRRGERFVTHDWNSTQRLLVEGSIPAFEAFFKVHSLSDVRAIGYTWEWGQSRAAFYAVANTKEGLEKGMISANIYAEPKLNPDQAREKVRWEAGYFPFPAGLTGPNDELGAAWVAEADRLHDLTEKMGAIDTSNEEQFAKYSRDYETFLAELVTVCCGALADIAKTGLFGDCKNLDFWVGSTDDNGDIVRDRDARIRKLIAEK